jgi:CheY-like chemotaxis protein
LLDLAMPVMDGCRFLELRFANTMLRRIQVIVVSGNSPSGEPLNGIEAFPRKPVDAGRLLRIVRTAKGLGLYPAYPRSKVP